LTLKRSLLVAVAACCCLLAGCVEWTEGPNGNLDSVGLPGLPVWQAKEAGSSSMSTAPDIEISQTGTGDLGGPVLVIPPAESGKVARYRYYEASDNHCEDDLKKMLADRAPGASGSQPYCSDSASLTPEKSASAAL